MVSLKDITKFNKAFVSNNFNNNDVEAKFPTTKNNAPGCCHWRDTFEPGITKGPTKDYSQIYLGKSSSDDTKNSIANCLDKVAELISAMAESIKHILDSQSGSTGADPTKGCTKEQGAKTRHNAADDLGTDENKNTKKTEKIEKSGETSTSGVTLEQLKAIMPNLSDEKAQQYLPELNKAMEEAGINTPKRQAAFLAQIAHESAELKYFEEIADGSAYEGRTDLGNTEPGDGKRYKGRGPIQLTGRANYKAAGEALGIDLVGNPDRAKDVDVAFRTATWFWNSHNLNSYADQGNFDQITKTVNGGYNGKQSRDAYYEKALSVLS